MLSTYTPYWVSLKGHWLHWMRTWRILRKVFGKCLTFHELLPYEFSLCFIESWRRLEGGFSEWKRRKLRPVGNMLFMYERK